MKRAFSKFAFLNIVPTRIARSKFFAVSRMLCLALLMLSVQAQPLLACPTCKGSLHGAAAMGYAISIVFMMAMPFAILLFWIVTIMRLRAKMIEATASENSQ